MMLVSQEAINKCVVVIQQDTMCMSINQDILIVLSSMELFPCTHFSGLNSSLNFPPTLTEFPMPLHALHNLNLRRSGHVNKIHPSAYKNSVRGEAIYYLYLEVKGQMRLGVKLGYKRRVRGKQEQYRSKKSENDLSSEDEMLTEQPRSRRQRT